MEWQSVVAPSATALVGVTGIVFTWLSGKQGREHAERLARQANDHAAAMAREERQQQRLADTYVALLDMTERGGLWAQAVMPMLDTVPPQPVPNLPELPEQAAVEARVGAFCSHTVRDLMEQWRDVMRQMTAKVGLIELERKEAESGKRRAADWGDLHKELHLELRPKERAARQALIDQIANELGHRPRLGA